MVGANVASCLVGEGMVVTKKGRLSLDNLPRI